MTTLTDDQLADYRMQAANCKIDEISDPQIQAYYDKAVTFGEDDETTEARTMVYMLRKLMGIYSEKVDVGGEIETERRSQLYDHVQDKLLPYWEGLAGM